MNALQDHAHALARALRWASSSTARSGMVRRKVAPMVPSTSLISPPWARTSSAAMTRPRPVPPLRAEVWNASNRCSRDRGRDARAGVRHLDHHHGALAPPGDADLIARRIVRRARLQRLHGVARQIEQDAKQLVGIGIDNRGRARSRRSRRSAIRPSASVSCTSSTSASAATGLRSGGGSCTRP